MQTTPPLTRYIGQTERTLQALLHRQLAPAGLTFPEWAILTFLGRGPLPRADVVKLLEDGRVAASADAQATIEAMIAKRLISAEGGRLAVTEDGAALFAPVRSAVEQITAQLFGDLPGDDLAATRRVLEMVAERAERLLSSNAA